MTRFEYLLVFLGIIAGLALTTMLKGAASLCGGEANVVFYWVPVVWAVILFLLLVQWWWVLWGWKPEAGKGEDNSSFASSPLTFLLALIFPSAVYYGFVIIFPEREAGLVCNMKAHYFSHYQWLFGGLIVGLLALAVEAKVTYGERLLSKEGLARVGAILPILICFMFPNETTHAVCTIGCGALLAGYLTLLRIKP